ncbi:MAG: response regulator [Candidatus Dormibacteria bacterium]
MPETVLLVDDDARLQLLGRKVLERAGFAVQVAGDGETAVALVRERAPALVLMDISMPVMDGIEATRLIKEHDPSVPVIAVTAHAMSGDRERFAAVGCDDFLAKPYEIKALLEVVTRFLIAPEARDGNGVE